MRHREVKPARGMITLIAAGVLAPVVFSADTFVEDLPFAHRPQTLRSGVFFNDRFASNRWEPGDPDPPAVESSHYAYFSERYIAGDHESTKAFGLWQYATVATNGVTQGDYAAGKATFMAHLRHAMASPGKWLAEDCARKSRKTVLQVSLMPWYLSESSNTNVVENPIIYANRRMYTSQAQYMDLVQAFAYELITTIDWTGRERYWEGPITEPQRYWRGSLAQLSQLYQDFARSIKAAEDAAVAEGLSTGTYKVGGSSTAAWWMAITVTDSPPGPDDGPDPGPPSPLVEINKRLIDDHLLNPATPLDFISWHQVRGPSCLHPDDPYPGLPESGFNGAEPGWCSTAMATTRGWVTAAGGDPDELEYILTEWYNLTESFGNPPGLYAAVAEINSRANIARNDLGGPGFELASRTVWEDWANIPYGDDGGPGLYHKVGRYPKPLMTLQQALHKIGSMSEVHVEHINYDPPMEDFGAAIYGRSGTSYMVVEGYRFPWTLQLESARELTVTGVTRMDGSTAYPGTPEAPPPPSSSISIPADAWEVLIVEFHAEDMSDCPADFDCDGVVDTADLLYLLGAWGTPDGDVDDDGDTDTADLLALLAAWGVCP